MSDGAGAVPGGEEQVPSSTSNNTGMIQEVDDAAHQAHHSGDQDGDGAGASASSSNSFPAPKPKKLTKEQRINEAVRRHSNKSDLFLKYTVLPVQ